MSDDRDILRSALAQLPDDTSHGETPDPEHVYFPQSHLKALHPDVVVVTGMRGAGKTFWWGALQNTAVRTLIGDQHIRAKVNENTVLKTGFGVRPAVEEYPSKDVISQLAKSGVEPRLIWRTVQAWQVAPVDHPMRSEGNWKSRVAYVQASPEAVDRLFQSQDAKFDNEGRYCLVAYDALDRSADDWRGMYQLIRGLLLMALEMRSYRRLRAKVFLRSDQFNEAAIGNFPDASKVLASAVDLSWPRLELYGLLWHQLGNATTASAEIRPMLHREQWRCATVRDRPIWQVPHPLLFKDAVQRSVFHNIAGEWMGRDPRRGFPYTWIPNHLGDTEGQVSPRSFIVALRSAAEDTQSQHPDHTHALHYESVRRGVQAASTIRVRELREDYPWVDRLMTSLQGLVVPCSFSDIANRWAEKDALNKLRDEVEEEGAKLPPSHIEDGPSGVRLDLESLRIFLRMFDGRVNVPDVFRVGYRLGRRGGVQPVQ